MNMHLAYAEVLQSVHIQTDGETAYNVSVFCILIENINYPENVFNKLYFKMLSNKRRQTLLKHYVALNEIQ